MDRGNRRLNLPAQAKIIAGCRDTDLRTGIYTLDNMQQT